MNNIILKENDFMADYHILEKGLKDSRESINNNLKSEELIEKIIKTYLKYDEAYTSGVWTWIKSQQKNLFKLLQERDNLNLEKLYANLFRDKNISNGLVSHNLLGGRHADWKSDEQTEEPLKQSKEVFAEDLETRKKFINLLLQDINTCKELTELDEISDLDFPLIGNPYGIVLDDALITSDQPRHYYDAKRIYDITSDIDDPVIFEIGGGYGGLLMNLVKVFGNKKFKYINIDILPTALSFIYVADTFLSENEVFVNHGNKITTKILEENNIILNIYSKKNIDFETDVDIVVNSHSLSEMSFEDITKYMDMIKNNNALYFYHTNSNFYPWKDSKKGHVDIDSSKFPIKNYKKISHCVSPWLCGGNTRYREFLYQRLS
jgi:putative sugar O-methyltransferase